MLYKKEKLFLLLSQISIGFFFTNAVAETASSYTISRTNPKKHAEFFHSDLQMFFDADPGTLKINKIILDMSTLSEKPNYIIPEINVSLTPGSNIISNQLKNKSSLGALINQSDKKELTLEPLGIAAEFAPRAKLYYLSTPVISILKLEFFPSIGKPTGWQLNTVAITQYMLRKKHDQTATITKKTFRNIDTLFDHVYEVAINLIFTATEFNIGSLEITIFPTEESPKRIVINQKTLIDEGILRPSSVTVPISTTTTNLENSTQAPTSEGSGGIGF